MANIAELPDIDAAMARLADAEQAEANPDQQPVVPAEVETTADQPAETAIPATERPASNPTDTPAAPESQPSTEPKTEPVKPADNKSNYAKDRQRRDDSWKALNAEK